MSNPPTASGAVLTHTAAPGQGYELDGTTFVGDFSDVTQDITAVFDFWNGGRLDVSLADGTAIFQDLVEALDLTAGSGNDSVFAYVYDDTIYGGLGDDTVLGDAGDDVLAGGDGDDLLDAGEGTDTVFGGAGDDVLAWNRSFSGLGHFDGGDGLDTLTYQGGEIRGTFTNFEVLNGAGSSIQATVEALNSFSTLQVSVVSLLDGGVIDFSGRTLGGIQVYGYSGGAGLTITTGDGNDVIYGGSGSDSLYGAGGNDSLAPDAAYEEFDTDVDYLYGGDGNDTLDYGNYNQGGDVFDGGAGTDILSYSSGQLRGTFTGVEILEAGGEIAAAPEALDSFDVINAYLVKLVSGGAIDLSGKAGTIHDIWSLTAENVTVTGTAGDNAITGSSGNDVLNGGDGDDGLVGRSSILAVGPYSDSNVLNGGAGNDTLEGSGGHDTLNGGTGDDFISSSHNSRSVEVDPNLGGIDVIDGGAGWDVLYYNRFSSTQGALYDFDQGGTAEGFVAPNGTTFRSIEEVELWAGKGNDAFIGGYGNDEAYGGLGADTLKGGAGNDSLYGSEGDDLISGGAGDDLLFGLTGRDTLSYGDATASVTVTLGTAFTIQDTGGAGVDAIGEVENLIGSVFADRLTGNQYDNVLDGGAGGDRLVGGLGDDTYLVDNAADSVGENHLEGNDTIISSVTYTLAGRAVEVLTLAGSTNLSGTGNSLNNTLNGNLGNNTLDGGAGNDVLNGGTGADRMLGGLGDDTYYVDSLSDSVGENHLEGTDTIITTMSYSLFGRAVEVLTMTGSANLTAVGNSLNNTLSGNAGNNVLDGGTGADKMVGGVGDDTYYVDHVQDNVSEQHLQGTDTVYASVSYSFFGRAAEILTLTGAGNINGTGNSLVNSLTGNGGNNTLDGAGGNDLLSGGLGSDVFLFGLGSGSDTVTDFSAAQNDIVNIHAFTNGAASASLVSQSGADVLITLGGGNMVTVENATRADVLVHIVW